MRVELGPRGCLRTVCFCPSPCVIVVMQLKHSELNVPAKKKKKKVAENTKKICRKMIVSTKRQNLRNDSPDAW